MLAKCEKKDFAWLLKASTLATNPTVHFLENEVVLASEGPLVEARIPAKVWKPFYFALDEDFAGVLRGVLKVSKGVTVKFHLEDVLVVKVGNVKVRPLSLSYVLGKSYPSVQTRATSPQNVRVTSSKPTPENKYAVDRKDSPLLVERDDGYAKVVKKC